jgi:signal transduction histidine kinase
MQIRARLTLLFLLLTASVLAGVLAAVYWQFEQNTEEVFFEGLQSKIELTAQTALRDPTTLRPLPPNWVAPDGDTLPHRDNISVFDDAYERVFSVNPDAPPPSLKDLQEIYSSGKSRFRHYNLHALGRAVEGLNGRQFAIVAEGYCDPTGLIRLRNILVISFLIGILLIAALGWYFAGQALAPVSRIVGAVEAMQPSDLSHRLPLGKSQDELARLAETFNRLLERVENAFRMQRMFLSNVSHELKNPLTAIRAQLDVTLQRERSPDAYRQALQSVLDDVRSLSDVEEKLLQLARLYNNPDAVVFEHVRLDELLWQAKEQVQKRHPDYRVALDFGTMPATEAQLFVRANEALLRTALLNLLDNGCKYSPDHRVGVSVHFRADGDHEIAVRDHGPGIPAEELALVFEPFFRSPRHRALKGTGIGLSLVRSILLAHQVAFSVESPPGEGATFRLVFPKK